MTNLEYWHDKLIEIYNDGEVIALCDNKPIACFSVDDCETCDFIDIDCGEGLFDWLTKEYEG